MTSFIRRYFNYSNVVVTLALLLAMSGGAYATARHFHFVITSKRQIKPSVLKEIEKSQRGPIGPQGPIGPKGDAGTAGAPGSPGAPGANGESVKTTSLVKGNSSCKEGGAEFKVGSGTATFACNGAPGAPGNPGTPGTPGESVKITTLTSGPNGSPECNKEGGSEFTVGTTKGTACNGSPWVAGGTLPSGKSEVGTWALVMGPENKIFKKSVGFASISFTIPVAKQPQAHFLNVGEGKTTECPGTAAEPQAATGSLCIYTEESLAPPPTIQPVVFGTVGAFVEGVAEPTESGGVLAGTWAVTAE